MKKSSKIVVLCIAIVTLLSFSAYASNDLVVDLDGITMDIQQVAEENGVDPYELKEAIEKEVDSERFSPFSNLVTNIQKAAPLESVSVGVTKTTVTKSNQDSTAYVAASGALTASGKKPAIGMCAMHVNVTTKTGNTTSTIVRLGTKINLTKSVNVNGTTRNKFVVEDRGPAKNRTPYWIDIYFGLNTKANKQAAINYGVKPVTYSYSY